jgi:hypothetical protein
MLDAESLHFALINLLSCLNQYSTRPSLIS